jgi:hypothetical protein
MGVDSGTNMTNIPSAINRCAVSLAAPSHVFVVDGTLHATSIRPKQKDTRGREQHCEHPTRPMWTGHLRPLNRTRSADCRGDDVQEAVLDFGRQRPQLFRGRLFPLADVDYHDARRT